jgi:hypothetical protein
MAINMLRGQVRRSRLKIRGGWAIAAPLRTMAVSTVVVGVNEFIIPNYKQTWGAIRKLSDAPEGVKHATFKSQEYAAG